jgi:hypothetical protein
VPTKTTRTAAYAAVAAIISFPSAFVIQIARTTATARTNRDVVSRLVNGVGCSVTGELRGTMFDYCTATPPYSTVAFL